jgi:PleD family two-component response regulator
MTEGKEHITVYLADDCAEDRKYVKESFKGAEIAAKFFVFDSERKLMNALGQAAAFPDVIFLTFNLDNELTLTCLKRIRTKKKFSDVPVIIFSVCSYLQDIQEAFENGANLFIPKPVFNEHRVQTLKAIFKPNWRRSLLRTNKARFVLKVDSECSEQISWSHS